MPPTTRRGSVRVSGAQWQCEELTSVRYFSSHLEEQVVLDVASFLAVGSHGDGGGRVCVEAARGDWLAKRRARSETIEELLRQVSEAATMAVQDNGLCLDGAGRSPLGSGGPGAVEVTYGSGWWRSYQSCFRMGWALLSWESWASWASS